MSYWAAGTDDDREAMRERNRDIIAQRAGDPPETVAGCRQIERECPGYLAVWSETDLSHRRAGKPYGARKQNATWRDRTYFGDTPSEIIEQIKRDSS